MGWPWLDVRFWAACVGAEDDADALTAACMTATAVHAPDALGSMMGESTPRDPRDREAIIASVIEAESRGWAN